MLISVFEQGLIYSILVLGVMVTYSILDFPDLTVDSSFPLGAAVSVVLTIKGLNPALTLVIALLAGGLSGLVTGIIHVKFKIRDLLSGIITMTGLYSINLAIVNSSNLPMFSNQTLFKNDFLKQMPSFIKPYSSLIILLVIVIIAKLLLDFFLSTKLGFLLRAVGDNPSLVTTLAKDKGSIKILGLVIANAYVALSGAIMSQHQRFFEISMGTGAIVIGLAAVIIGTVFLGRFKFLKSTSCVILGSIIYKACVAIAISLGLPSIYMRLIIAVLFFLILVLGNTIKRRVSINA